MRIGCDVDGVLANFAGFCADMGLATKWGTPEGVWRYLYGSSEFWYDIPPYRKGPLPFSPIIYITSRPTIMWNTTVHWLRDHGFLGNARVEAIGFDTSKYHYVKDNGLDLFIDDNADNFVEINDSGTTCLLLDRPWNQDVHAGKLRIYNLDEVKEWVDGRRELEKGGKTYRDLARDLSYGADREG